jgi:hypothetical protein
MNTPPPGTLINLDNMPGSKYRFECDMPPLTPNVSLGEKFSWQLICASTINRRGIEKRILFII